MTASSRAGSSASARAGKRATKSASASSCAGLVGMSSSSTPFTTTGFSSSGSKTPRRRASTRPRPAGKRPNLAATTSKSSATAPSVVAASRNSAESAGRSTSSWRDTGSTKKSAGARSSCARSIVATVVANDAPAASSCASSSSAAHEQASRTQRCHCLSAEREPSATNTTNASCASPKNPARSPPYAVRVSRSSRSLPSACHREISAAVLVLILFEAPGPRGVPRPERDSLVSSDVHVGVARSVAGSSIASSALALRSI
mmetsp:Transcript_9352/g.38321  ORF Transcript_9352/g.38321 Transcript_9352/m.38321 type:complete len:260 (-) Transcript_9352:280-1059(-)